MAKVGKKELKQHMNHRAKLTVREEELMTDDFSTRDTVTGSQADFPYTQRAFTLTGRDETRIAQITAELARLEKKCKAVEDYVDSIEDGFIQSLIKLHYLQGLSWPQVRRKLRITNLTADALRKKVDGFLENN